MGSAPIVYINKIDKNGRKYIAPKEPEAALMRSIFEQPALGKLLLNNFYNKQHIQEATQKGSTSSGTFYFGY